MADSSAPKDYMELAVVLDATVENPDVGDLFLDSSGQEVLISDMVPAVTQRLRVRFEFFLGEWFLDLSEGTPYYEHILVKAPSDRAIRTIFGSVIRKTEGVSELVNLTYALNRNRQLSVSFKARCADGSIVKITDYPAFVVDADAKVS